MKIFRDILFLLFFPCIFSQNITVAIIGTNDIHGAALPTLMVRGDTKQKYNYGGLPVLARLIQIIKSQHPGNTVYLDGGDQFQGGIESSPLISSGKIMNDFYSLSQVQGSAIGNHQFDFGPGFLFPFMAAKDSPNIAANLRSETGAINFLPKQTSSQMYTLSSGIKIGVIGLITLQTPSTTAAFEKGLFPKYRFQQYRAVILEESSKLKKSGANAIIVVGHVGNQCPNNYDYGIWTSATVQPNCKQNDQIDTLIKSLPQGTIHGVVQGHRHTVSHVFINGIPVMGNINGGYYFNVMYLTFNSHKSIVQSKIEGPIPVCEKIFQKTGKCNYVQPQKLQAAGPLVKWRFHNQQVFPEPRLNTIYNEQWVPKMQKFLVELVENQIYLARYYDRQCEVANLVNNLVHSNFTFADFTLLNVGGFRTEWLPGVLMEQHLYNMFPFDNVFKSFNISGAELLKSLKILQQGSNGLYQFSGIQTTVKKNGDKFQFVSGKMSDGSQIEANKYYTGVTTDFLLGGGDDFKDIINVVYKLRDVKVLGQFKESFRQLLKDMKTIKKGSLIDPNNPRIIIL